MKLEPYRRQWASEQQGWRRRNSQPGRGGLGQSSSSSEHKGAACQSLPRGWSAGRKTKNQLVFSNLMPHAVFTYKVATVIGDHLVG